MDQLHSHVSKAPCQILRKILESLTGQTSLITSRLGPFLSHVYLPLTSKPKSQSVITTSKMWEDVNTGPIYQAKKNSGYFKKQTDIQDGTPSFRKERWGGSNAGGFVCPIGAVLGRLRSSLSARHRVGSELLV